MAKMPSRLKVDHFPKNGKTTGNPHLPNITAKVAKPSLKEGKGENMPEMRSMAKPKQYTDNAMGEGFKKPSFGIGPKGASLAKGSATMAPSAPTHKDGNHPEHGNSGRVPHGNEHHQANHREPRTHSEFHALGSVKGDKY